jgi:hypothetical protein
VNPKQIQEQYERIRKEVIQEFTYPVPGKTRGRTKMVLEGGSMMEPERAEEVKTGKVNRRLQKRWEGHSIRVPKDRESKEYFESLVNFAIMQRVVNDVRNNKDIIGMLKRLDNRVWQREPGKQKDELISKMLQRFMNVKDRVDFIELNAPEGLKDTVCAEICRISPSAYRRAKK